MNDDNLKSLLSQWEETYKKGLLSFWLLLLLKQRKAYPYEIKDEISRMSQQTIRAEENSIYRALRRLAQSGVVDSEVQPSETGPDRRYFFLTQMGIDLLEQFIVRNILVFQHPQVSNLIQSAINTNINERNSS